MRQQTLFFLAVAALFSTAAHGSIPWGRTFGEWRVGGITSVSGTGSDDAAANFSQQHDDVSLEVRWNQGASISVSARAENCFAEDDDFYAGYNLSPSKWQANPRSTRVRVKADMQAWLKQIEFLCNKPGISERFEFGRFDRAFEVFTGWVAN